MPTSRAIATVSIRMASSTAIEEAKRIADPAKRRELYTEAWNIVHEELPQFHLHELSAVSAAHKSVQGYQPADVAAFTYRQGGVRTAYIA